MAPMPRSRRNFLTAMGFLLPNIGGFLVFTLVPLAMSLGLAFSDWDLKKHNSFLDNPIHFIGTENFTRLFAEPNFQRFFQNTLFMMLGIPFGIVGSLVAAMLLQKHLAAGGSKKGVAIALGVLCGTGLAILAANGFGASTLTLVLLGIAGGLLFGGVTAGVSVYRTAFYLPCFTAGVAVYILWKKLYNPQTGPLNRFLAGPLSWLGDRVNDLGPEGAARLGAGLAILCGVVVAAWGVGSGWIMRRWRRDGELGMVPVVLWCAALLLAMNMTKNWMIPAPEAAAPAVEAAAVNAAIPDATSAGAVVALAEAAVEEGKDAPEQAAAAIPVAAGLIALAGLAAGLLMAVGACLWPLKDETSRALVARCPADRAIGTALLLAAVGVFVTALLAGLANVAVAVPAWAASNDGLQPPNWLSNYYWAKPALMLMGFWAAIGSNNMLLYLAGLSNVPMELYEAADIDGARPWQRFWNVTWPQLAPVTFFIVVLSIIGGLQGGFESARTMTNGGPAGATTTLAYFIYIEGFETGRLGYASAVAWTLCLLVFCVTMFNWRFGSRYADE